MVVFFLSIILLTVFMVPMVIWRINGGDLFGPIMINGFMHVVTIIPYLFILSYDSDILGNLVLSRINDLEISVAIYVLLQSIAYLFIVLGISSRFANTVSLKLPKFNTTISKKTYRTAFFISFLIGFIAFVYMIQTSGGFLHLLNNLEQRSSILSGVGYISVFVQLLTFAVVLLVYSKKVHSPPSKNIIIAFFVILVMLIETTSGARKDAVFLLFFVFIVAHYSYYHFKNIPKKAWLILFFVFLYALSVPLLRDEGGIEHYANSPEALIGDSIDNASNSLNGVSYVRHYLLVTNEFSVNDIWLGKSYLDLLVAPIPSNFYEGKPPIDDGVYLRTLAEGREVSPPMPYNELFPSSWPPETFGAMYMNFWIPGLFIGMYLLGFFYKITYTYMKNSNYSFFSIFLYGHIIINFELSNLRIVQAITFLSVLLIFSFVFFQISLDRSNKNKK
ncbi:O-antigen polymerase [Alkalicoccus saliphilus]|uniref:Oligosaccharide repeat unit polymerase n=1 Tax=Alkalicoccus saliphilus TaxID=200989 RepID=A0A2T4U3B7_9BACI|nr:O-antigen polymerase [Alkalicoccus saliphilus]PTL37903.1 hypothetical protein C6Y45_13965 [Alkalicoccus saliphilus]